MEDRLCRALHQQVDDEAQGPCLLLFSPELRQLAGLSVYEDALASREKTTVALPTASFPDQQEWPWLTTLDTTKAADSHLLNLSAQAGLEELDPELIKRGRGRRQSGWLVSKQSPKAVSAHLSGLLIQRDPHGQRAFLRLTDPAVLWAIWPLLTTSQQAHLLGPIQAWWLLDPAGNLVKLTASSDTLRSATLALTAHQWSELGAVQALNRAINRLLMQNKGEPVWSAEEMSTRAARGLHAVNSARRHAIADESVDEIQTALQAMAD